MTTFPRRRYPSSDSSVLSATPDCGQQRACASCPARQGLSARCCDAPDSCLGVPSQPQASVEEPTAWRDASPRAVLALGAVVGAATMLVCAAVVSGLYAHGYAAGWQDGRYGTGHTVVLDGPFAPGQDFGGPAPAPQPLPWQVSPSDPQFDPGTPEYGFGGAGQGHFVPQR